jgi:hypothetical protein
MTGVLPPIEDAAGRNQGLDDPSQVPRSSERGPPASGAKLDRRDHGIGPALARPPCLASRPDRHLKALGLDSAHQFLQAQLNSC